MNVQYKDFNDDLNYKSYNGLRLVIKKKFNFKMLTIFLLFLFYDILRNYNAPMFWTCRLLSEINVDQYSLLTTHRINVNDYLLQKRIPI